MGVNKLNKLFERHGDKIASLDAEHAIIDGNNLLYIHAFSIISTMQKKHHLPNRNETIALPIKEQIDYLTSQLRISLNEFINRAFNRFKCTDMYIVFDPLQSPEYKIENSFKFGNETLRNSFNDIESTQIIKLKEDEQNRRDTFKCHYNKKRTANLMKYSLLNIVDSSLRNEKINNTDTNNTADTNNDIINDSLFSFLNDDEYLFNYDMNEPLDEEAINKIFANDLFGDIPANEVSSEVTNDTANDTANHIANIIESSNNSEKMLELNKTVALSFDVIHNTTFLNNVSNVNKIIHHVTDSLNNENPNVKFIQAIDEADLVIKNICSKLIGNIVVISRDTDYKILLSDLPNCYTADSNFNDIYNPYEVWKKFFNRDEIYKNNTYYSYIVRCSALFGNDYVGHDRNLSTPENDYILTVLFDDAELKEKLSHTRLINIKSLLKTCEQFSNGLLNKLDAIDLSYRQLRNEKYQKYVSFCIVYENWEKFGKYEDYHEYNFDISTLYPKTVYTNIVELNEEMLNGKKYSELKDKYIINETA